MLTALVACFTISRLQPEPLVIDVSTTQELRVAMAQAQPGQTVRIKSGTYDGGVHLKDIHGEKSRPITLSGLDPKNPPRFVGGVSGLQFSDISHVVIENLSVTGCTGNGINIDDGGTIDTPSHDVVLRKVTVTKLPKGNHDAIKLSGVDRFRVEDCRLEEWGGSGIDMVGCHDGVIVRCQLINGGDSGVQCKGGTSGIQIESCRFESFGQRGVNIGGSTGLEFFRPALSKMKPDEKYEARDITVQGCTFVKGGSPIAFVGVLGSTVSRNTFIEPGRWIVRILQETREKGFVPSQKGVFTDNLVAFRSTNWSAGGFNVGSGTAPETFSFARNFWICIDAPQSSRPQCPTPEVGGVYGEDPQFVDFEGGDFNVNVKSPAKNMGAHSFKSGH